MKNQLSLSNGFIIMLIGIIIILFAIIENILIIPGIIIFISGVYLDNKEHDEKDK